MAHDQAWVGRYRDELERYTKYRFEHFFCPWTLVDYDGELADGHVINRHVKFAQRQTVPQRKDFDAYFDKLEATAVHYLNLFQQKAPVEMLKGAKDIIAAGPGGVAVELFPHDPVKQARRERASSLPVLQFETTNGQVLGPWVMNTRNRQAAEAVVSGGIPTLTWTGVIDEMAATAAFIRSGFLALFRRHPFFAVGNPAMKFVRDPFVRFWRERAKVEDTRRYFGRFAGAPMIARGEAVERLNTMLHGAVIMHSTGGFPNSLPFAVSVFLSVGPIAVVVPLPFADGTETLDESMRLYDAFVRDHSLPHVKQLLRPTGGAPEVIELNMELEAGPSSSSRRRYVIEMRPDSWQYIPLGEEDHGDVGPAGDAAEAP